MNAKELRIGNYIIENVETDIIGRVKGVNSYEADNTERVVYTERQTTPEEFIQPLPLTEEWLIKFRFKKYLYSYKLVPNLRNANKSRILNNKLLVEIVERQDKFYIKLGGQLKKEVGNVHHLQNIYFALTGEELEVVTKHKY